MAELQGNPTFSVLFLLVFLEIAALVERFEKKGRIRSLLKKIPWDTLWTVFVYWAGILVLRKILYYKPMEGVIQTKDSLWWADINITYIAFPVVWLILVPLGIVIKSKVKQPFKFLKDKQTSLVMGVAFVVGMLGAIFFFVGTDYGNLLWEFIMKSLLPLKVICAGKYIGLLTAVLLAYYIADGNKRLKKITIPIKKRKLSVNVFIGSGLFVIFLILSLVNFTGGWDKKFTAKLHNAQTGKSVKKFEDLLDAVNSIKSEQEQANGLKVIAVTISKTGDWQWALDVTKTIKVTWISFDTLKQIFLITSRSGNRYESEAVLEEMFDFVKPLDDIDKFRALKEIEQLTFKTGNTTWIIKIIQQEVLSAVRIDDPKERVRALTKIAADIAAMGYKNRVKEIFQQAIEQVKNIKYQKDQSLLLKEVAVTIAKTGDTQWAEVVAQGIANKGMKNRALAQIRKWIKEK